MNKLLDNSHRQPGVPIETKFSLNKLNIMDNLFTGKSFPIKIALTEEQQKLIDAGFISYFYHKVPTEKEPVPYIRSTVKGIIVNEKQNLLLDSNGILSRNPQTPLVLNENLELMQEKTNIQKIKLNEAVFIQTSGNLAILVPEDLELAKMSRNLTVEYATAASIKEGEKIAVVKELPNGKEMLVSAEKARLWMLMFGDGHVRKSLKEVFITSERPEILENFSSLCKEFFNRTAKIEAPYARINSVKIAKELSGLGFLSKDKPTGRIPKEILNSSETVLLNALGGLIDTDGNISKNQLRIDTSFYSIALDIVTLLLKLGLFATINQSKTTFGVRVKLDEKMSRKISQFVISKDKKKKLEKIKNTKKAREHELYEIDGQIIRNLRKQNNDTLDSLAKKLGTDFRLISGWENNKRRIPKEKLSKIAVLYGNEKLGKFVNTSLTTVKVKKVELLRFETPKEFIYPQTKNTFITNFILARKA